VWNVILKQEKLVNYLRGLSETIKETKGDRDSEYKRRLV
jgi:hypothetical protein